MVLFDPATKTSSTRHAPCAAQGLSQYEPDFSGHDSHDDNAGPNNMSRENSEKRLRTRQTALWADSLQSCWLDISCARGHGGYRTWSYARLYGPILPSMARLWRQRGCIVHVWSAEDEFVARVYPDGRVDRRAWYHQASIGPRRPQPDS